MKICKNCGKNLSCDDKFCPNCGEKVEKRKTCEHCGHHKEECSNSSTFRHHYCDIGVKNIMSDNNACKYYR